MSRADDAFADADFGFRLDEDDRRRRYVIQSLLPARVSTARLSPTVRHRPLADLPGLAELGGAGPGRPLGDRLALTDAGLERSDAIGPWLYSERVRRLMEDYAWR